MKGAGTLLFAGTIGFILLKSLFSEPERSPYYTDAELKREERAAWNASVRPLAFLNAKGCGDFDIKKDFLGRQKL